MDNSEFDILMEEIEHLNESIYEIELKKKKILEKLHLSEWV